MNEKDKKDVYDQLKDAGFIMAQNIYRAENTGIDGIEDLIKKYTGRLFNYIHNGKVAEFLLYLEKMCAGIYIQPPKPTIELLRAQNTRRFKEYALAFMMGFMADKKQAKEGGQNE